VGKYLTRKLLSRGFFVTGLGTSTHHPFMMQPENYKWICADTSRKGAWQKHVPTADVVINLAGRTIFKPWTKRYRQEIYDSRILTTKHLVAAMEKGKPVKLLSASAVGYYGDQGETVLSETDPVGSGFLAMVCQDWENRALEAKDKGALVCTMRFGVVLGNEGALSVMAPAFKWFLGGPMGNGGHWFPWIHVNDLYRAIKFIMDDPDLEGSFNFTAPGLVRQKEFSRVLGRVLNRPSIMPAPAFMVKLLMGDLGSSLLQSQKALSRRLLEHGFDFEFHNVKDALADIFKKQ